MYGMIHQALREMICESHGAAAWHDVEQAAGTGPAHMISASVYPDDVTSRLVTAAAQRTGRAPDALLEEFGRHWFGFAERGPYGSIMRFTGRTLVEFVDNLDRMHQSIQTSMPEARMPSFRVAETGPGLLVIDYGSTRKGLAPLVVGLFQGLLARFGLTGTITLGAAPDGRVRLHVAYGSGDG